MPGLAFGGVQNLGAAYLQILRLGKRQTALPIVKLPQALIA
jgi:hypothetical protein